MERAQEKTKTEEPRTSDMEVTAGAADLAGKYLTFLLADEEYCLEIMKVQEIIGLMPIAKVPRVPDYVRGVINLRGKIIPTVELRAKFGIESNEDTDRTCIIVVEVESARGKINIGIIVDEVAEVMDFDASEIDDTPEFGANLDTSFILGVGVVQESVKIILDIDKLLSSEEVEAMGGIAQN